MPADARHPDIKVSAAGFSADGRRCWTLGKSKLMVWTAEQEVPAVLPVGLPYDVSDGFISAAAVKESPNTACIMCTPEGNVFAWPELSQIGQQEPLQARFKQDVTSISDLLVVAHDFASTVMFAILGTADGRLYRLDCINLGTAAEAISITPLQQPEKGLMGSLSQFWGKRALPAAKAAVSALQLIHDGHTIQILVLSKVSLDCWQTSMQPGASAHMLWSQPVLSTMQQQGQNLEQLSCCSLSAIAMSGSRHNVAVLASMSGPVRQELPGAVSSAVAVTADVDSPHWLILTSTEVVQLPMSHPKAARSVAPSVILQAEPLVDFHTAAQPEGAGRRRAADAAPGVPQDQVFQLLSTAVYTAAEDPQRQHSLQQLRRMAPRLQEPPGPLNDVAVFSNRIIDTLPKQWGRAPAAGYLDQLQDKQTYHQILLTTLDDIQLMHVLDPAALRAIFESAEKLEAVSAVREYENEQRAANSTEPLGLLQDIVLDAGRECASQASGPLEQRKEQEMFYSCPSVSAEAFFRAVSSQLASLEGSSYASSPESQLKQTHEVAQAVQSVLGKAHARNQELTQTYQREMFRLPTDTPWWSAGLAVRTALQALADTLARLAEALKTSNATYFEKAVTWLLTMSEAVLSAYTHAMDTCQAAAPHAALKQDYERARNGYLQALLVIAADQGESAFGTHLVQAVEQLADAHRAYAQLFQICELQRDEHKLHAYMVRHRIMLGNHLDLDHSAVSYVFDRLLEEGQHARLLSFPDQFNQDVSQWLRTRLAAAGSQRATAAALRRLTWLHELRMKQYDSACRTLADVTNNNEGDAARVHRAACIAKLSKLASVPGPILKPSEEDLGYVSRQHAKIIMLEVQTALNLGSGQVHEFHQLLTACLSNDDDIPTEQAAQQACYVFLLLSYVKSPEQQAGYRQEFEAAWQRVAAGTDWQHLAELSQLASDSQINSMLCQTQLCHAAKLCYADPAHSVFQTFPPETCVDMLLELTGSKQDPVVRRLVEAALHHGCNGQYVESQQPDAEPGSPIDMQAD
ncbi:hypothetical protein ABBQ38_010884 [Trebouxia sp. C0009 RCD-2024]